MRKLTTRRALVLIVGVMLALAWAVPSIGASAGKVARTALARANLAVHDSNVARSQSDTAKSTANSANATAGAANSTANTANATATSAKTTANQALSLANAAVQIVDNFTNSTLDPNPVTGGSCDDYSISRLGVLSTDELIVTPPSTQPADLIVQAFTSSGAVILRFCNLGSGSVDPGPAAYEFSILR